MHYAADLVRQLAGRWGITGEPVGLAKTGMANDAWKLGSYIVRVLLPECDQNETAREAYLAPLALSLGIPTPRLVGVDTDGVAFGVRYSIWEWVDAALLGLIESDMSIGASAFFESAKHLALLHEITPSNEALKVLRRGIGEFPPGHIEKALAKGAITQAEANIALEWDRRLAKVPVVGPALTHADLHPWNIMVDPVSHELVSIIDWGDAMYGDLGIEFASCPLGLMETMFEGYRAAGGSVTPELVSRALYTGLGLAIWELYGLAEEGFSFTWSRIPPGRIAEMDRMYTAIARKYGI